MLLTHFVDQDGWLHWWRLGNGATVRKARPGEIFLQNHLYSTVSAAGSLDPSMENALSILEADATSVVSDIREAARNGTRPDLTNDQKRVWYTFFLTQWRRTPEMQRAIISDLEAMEMLERELDELREKLPHRRAEIEALSSPSAKARTLRNVRVDQLRRESANVLQILERRGIAILRITKRNKAFIVGSRPVVKLTMPGRNNLDDPSVEVWLPIASDIAVGVGRGDGGISLHLVQADSQIRHLNNSIANQSSTIAGRSEHLVRSISNRR